MKPAVSFFLLLFLTPTSSSYHSFVLHLAIISFPSALNLQTMSSSNNGAALLMCAVGICASYLYYGMLQEQLFSDAQVGASFLLLTQCISNTVVALAWQQLDRMRETKSSSTRQLHHPLLIMSTNERYCNACNVRRSDSHFAQLHFVTLSPWQLPMKV